MSTRGAVAWLDKDGKWVGIYNHFDSYPSGLGQEVWDELNELASVKCSDCSCTKKHYEVAVPTLLEALKQVGDWREYMNGGICEYCGKKAGQAHSIGGAAIWGESMGMEVAPDNPNYKVMMEAKTNIEATGFPDPEAKYHEHSGGAASQFDPRKDPLFIEWVYILKPEEMAIEVWAHGAVMSTHPGAVPLRSEKDTYYGHYLVDTVKLGKKGGMWPHNKLDEMAEAQGNLLRGWAVGEMKVKGIKNHYTETK